MNNLKTVIAFEYLNVVKSKSFIITAVIFMLLVIGLAFMPNIISFFSDRGEGNQVQVQQAAIIDDTGFFTDEVLANYFPQYSWSRYQIEDFEAVVQSVEAGDYELGVHFVTQTAYTLIFETGLDGAPHVNQFEAMMRETYQKTYLLAQGLEIGSIEQVMYIDIEANFISVGGAGFWVGYVALILVFFPLVMGGSLIGMSVVSEKTSKTVELLFTSAKPITIMTGKVIAGGLAIITQFAPIIATALIAISFTNNDLFGLLSPEVLAALMDPLMYVYVFIFALCAYVTFAFMYAAFASTVRDAQEAQSVQTIPSLLLVAAFYLGLMVSMRPAWLSETILNVISYIPIISPFVMIVRVTSYVLPTYQILIAIGVNILTLVLIAMISAKIYKSFIMNYGQKASIGLIFKSLRGN